MITEVRKTRYNVVFRYLSNSGRARFCKVIADPSAAERELRGYDLVRTQYPVPDRFHASVLTDGPSLFIYEWVQAVGGEGGLLADLLADSNYAEDTLFGEWVERICSHYVSAMVASVGRQTGCNLCKAARPRLTFSRMSEAVAVQMKGLGCWLC